MPAGVLGGVTTALYGLIGIIGVRIWVENHVDFSKPKNQFTAAVALIMGIANFTLTTGALSFSGIILGTVAAIVVYHLMHWISKWRGTEEPDAPAPTVPAYGVAADGDRVAQDPAS